MTDPSPLSRPRLVRPRHPLVELTLARIREFVREPEALFWVFVFPVLLAFALGIAFRSQPPEKLRVVLENNAPGPGPLMDWLAAAPDLQVLELAPADAGQALRTGKADLVVSPKPGPSYTFRYDPTRPQSRLARLRVQDLIERGLGRPDLAQVREEHLTAAGDRYIDFLIPGLIGLNLMGSGMWGVGFAVVQARTKKLLKRFAATPMRRSHYLLSFMLSRLAGLVLEVAALVGFGWLVFEVKLHGSWPALGIVSLLGSFTFAGLGLLLAARTSTIEAVSGWMNFVMLPMWLLSGTFFSYSRFPEFLHPLIRALPLTALNDALRAVMNEGLSLAHCWWEILVLLIWSSVSFVLALRLFRWQ